MLHFFGTFTYAVGRADGSRLLVGLDEGTVVGTSDGVLDGSAVVGIRVGLVGIAYTGYPGVGYV